jgi:hypothetical protein
MRGFFHGWGLISVQIDNEQNEGVITCAIVEGMDGRVYTLLPEEIRFVDKVDGLLKYTNN